MRRMILLFGVLMSGFCLGACSGSGADPGTESSEVTGTTTAETGESALASESDAGSAAAEGSWTKDVVLQDPWTPETTADAAEGDGGEASDGKLSVTASEALPLKLCLEQKNEKPEGYSSYEGGVEAEWGIVYPAEGEDLPEAARKALEEYNGRMEERAKKELAEGKVRQAAYQALEEGQDYIYLTSWLGMQAGRMDTRVMSWVERVYRYNREYEPNYYEVHGVTLDTQTGRRLALGDIFTDTSGLAERIFSYEESRNQIRRNHGVPEEIQALLQEAIDGERDDGSFAWCLRADSVEFRMIIDAGEEKDTFHYDVHVYLPLRDCGDILREPEEKVPYDYLEQYDAPVMADILGLEMPRDSEGKNYWPVYVVQKNGARYLWGCREEKTAVYALEEDGPVFSGEVLGEPGYVENSCFYLTADPEDMSLHARVSLLQELFLTAEARVGADGMPERKDLFYPEANPAPIMTGKGFAAETFADRESTEMEQGTVPEHTSLQIIRTNGTTFADAECPDNGRLYRLYLEGSDEEGWTVNGHPQEEVIAHIGWWEE